LPGGAAVSLELVTQSPEETERLGGRLARILPDGAVVALFGDLAAGKTCLVRGMSRMFGASASVHSPTFTLVNRYGRDRMLYHLDLYRLSGAEELADLGYEELFEPDGVCVVEWAERADGLLPARRVDVRIDHAGRDVRRIRMENHGALSTGWEDSLLRDE